jgi:hypothetical protein
MIGNNIQETSFFTLDHDFDFQIKSQHEMDEINRRMKPIQKREVKSGKGDGTITEVDRITTCGSKQEFFMLNKSNKPIRMKCEKMVDPETGNIEYNGINMSRCFGDFDCSKVIRNTFGFNDRVKLNIAIPTIQEYTLNDEDDFIFLSTDGMTDELGNVIENNPSLFPSMKSSGNQKHMNDFLVKLIYQYYNDFFIKRKMNTSFSRKISSEKQIVNSNQQKPIREKLILDFILDRLFHLVLENSDKNVNYRDDITMILISLHPMGLRKTLFI